MKKSILVFGGIAGLLVSLFVITMASLPNTPHSVVVGYSAMIIGFSLIFVGVRNFRDKWNGGRITFGKALLVGLGIAGIGSTIYVLAWLVDFYVFVPHFMDQYATQMIAKARASNLSPADLDKKIAGIRAMGEMYKSPVFVVLFTYLEVLPVGVGISLLSALILKRKGVHS
jgi:hypothetical protein